MASPQENSSFLNNISPQGEPQKGVEENEDYYEESFATDGCGCFRLFCFRWGRSNKGARRYRLQQQGESRESWWMEKLKKVKETTELLAGPKWKTFIRKFSFHGNNTKKRRSQFQYDPHSYALNFDDAADPEIDDDGGADLDFSSRFTAPSGMSSGELGRDPAGFPLNRY